MLVVDGEIHQLTKFLGRAPRRTQTKGSEWSGEGFPVERRRFELVIPQRFFSPLGLQCNVLPFLLSFSKFRKSASLFQIHLRPPPPADITVQYSLDFDRAPQSAAARLHDFLRPRV